MTDKKQPEALRLAALIEKTRVRGSLRDQAAVERDQAAVELRRQYAELETLRAGYDAARLEIESLRMRAGGALDAVLHEAVSAIYFDDSSKFKSALGCIVRTIDPALAGELLCHPKAAFDKSQARLDADRAMRAAQPAGAQQPGAAYAALPEYGINTASHAHFRVLGFTADQMHAFADATHALRASHGQAPAQAAQKGGA